MLNSGILEKIDRVHGTIKLLDGFIFDALTLEPNQEDLEVILEAWGLVAESWLALREALQEFDNGLTKICLDR